jgi:23S rRNA (adenine2503-C2)-methyltransferase
MKKIIDIPTGKIIIDEYSRGPLETLTIGDYGKSKNIKAHFLGFDKEINGVANGKCMPLSEKWVMTLSTQYGCQMSCLFCDAHNIKFGGNASFWDLKRQLMNARNEYPNVGYTDRLNIHFARMGEPVHNAENVFNFSRWLADKRAFQNETGLRVETIHPVFTTMCPRTPNNNSRTRQAIEQWVHMKNNAFNGQAGLQLSINTTHNEARDKMFNNLSMGLADIANMCRSLPDPLGRKYCLNFAVTDTTEINPYILQDHFDKNKFMLKITPIHNNNACRENGFETKEGYSSYSAYRDIERSLVGNGWDVLVFVPSMDEENGCVTCGNAILGGSELKLS